MNNPLYFRRQFLLANRTISEIHAWQHVNFGDAHLYAHPDLVLTEKKDQFRCLVLLGYIFDPARPTQSNEQILSDIISSITNFNEFITKLKLYSGRYAIIYRDDLHFKIINDPLGLREIYYCTVPNRVICGSQPNLLDYFSEPTLGITADEDIKYFYKEEMPNVRSRRLWVGDETFFNNVKHLIPNHHLDIYKLESKRYWPNKKLEKITIEEAAQKASDYLKGVLAAITSRYEVMMAVTSGYDSRSLFAASRNMADQIYYFINKHKHLDESSPDIRIPKTMFSDLNIPFHIHEVETGIDENFKEVFLNNVFMSTELMLPVIYNVYYKTHQDKINLLGVGEIGREYYGDAPSPLDGYFLARCLKYKDSKYATAQCDKWLKETYDIARSCDVDIMKLLLWECLLGNWGAVGNSESDIAIEEYDPYDSHYMYEILLSADQTNGDLFEAMFKEMWPELLKYPFNPPITADDKIKSFLSNLGILRHLKNVRYKYDRWKFHKVLSSTRS